MPDRGPRSGSGPSPDAVTAAATCDRVKLPESLHFERHASWHRRCLVSAGPKLEARGALMNRVLVIDRNRATCERLAMACLDRGVAVADGRERVRGRADMLTRRCPRRGRCRALLRLTVASTSRSSSGWRRRARGGHRAGGDAGGGDGAARAAGFRVLTKPFESRPARQGRAGSRGRRLRGRACGSATGLALAAMLWRWPWSCLALVTRVSRPARTSAARGVDRLRRAPS